MRRTLERSMELVVAEPEYSRFKLASRSPISPLSPQDSIISSSNAAAAASSQQQFDLTLQELEKALLGDDDDDEQQQQQQQQQQQRRVMLEGSSPEGLLLVCAEAIANNELSLASEVLARLRQVVSIFGDPMQRLAAYMMEGLVARVQCSGRGLYEALKCSEPPTCASSSSSSSPSEVLSAMQIMYEVCPYFKFGYMAANGAIAEAFKDEPRVHIVDLEIGQGTQWVTLIQALAVRPGGPPRVRITGIGGAASSSSSLKSLAAVGKRLERLGASVGVPLIFHPLLVAAAAEVEEWMLERDHGEALAVNFALQLHHVPDESVCPSNPRDSVLRMVKALRPKVVTLVEQEANTNTAPFLPRFGEALRYYAAVFDSLDAALPRDSRERVSVEQLCLARDIVNIVACEGAERVERHEPAGKWRARMAMAGFKPCPLSSFVNATIRQLLESYCSNYRLHEEAGCLYLGWLTRVLIVASAWC